VFGTRVSVPWRGVEVAHAHGLRLGLAHQAVRVGEEYGAQAKGRHADARLADRLAREGSIATASTFAVSAFSMPRRKAFKIRRADPYRRDQ